MGTPSDHGPCLLQEKFSVDPTRCFSGCFWRMPWKCRVVMLKPFEPRRVALCPLSRFFSSTLTLSPSQTTSVGPGRTPLKTRTGRTLPPSAILPGAFVKSCSRVCVKTQVLGLELVQSTPHVSPGTSSAPGWILLNIGNHMKLACQWTFWHIDWTGHSLV